MSATQLVGGALAAMTAAVIGAQLGVAGTVLGAAIGSVVAGAAGSLYTASLKHTKDKLASAFVGRVGETDVEVTTVSTTHRGRRLDHRHPARGRRRPRLPRPGGDRRRGRRAGRPVSRWPWKPILVSTAAVFLLAIAGITGFELVSGQSVSGGEGTTITQVSEGRSGGTDTPTQAPSSSTSTEPSTEPSATPSAGTSTEPSSEPEPSAEPSDRSRARARSRPPAPSRARAHAVHGRREDPQVGSNDTGTAGG